MQGEFNVKRLIFSLICLLTLNTAFSHEDLFRPDIRTEYQARERFSRLNDFFFGTRDEKIYFNGIYFLVTEGLMNERHKSKYRYPECLEAMVVEFANMYLKALKKNQVGLSPLPWNELFHFKGKPTTHLLLGMNAHISYDLPISIYRVSQRMKQCSAENIKSDYFGLNDFFIDLTPKLNRELKYIDFQLNHTKTFRPEGLKEAIVIELVLTLRDRAWDSFLHLQTAKNQLEYESMKKELESDSHNQALFFKTFNFLLPRVGY
jgi:hypothetical protein